MDAVTNRDKLKEVFGIDLVKDGCVETYNGQIALPYGVEWLFAFYEAPKGAE